jgi:aryl-alcohol dehydrogenase-like predicted oxidoreductase
VQNAYGVGASAEQQALLRRCGELGTAFVPFFAIAGFGGAAGPAEQESEAVDAVARAQGVSVAQVRLAWTLQQRPHVLAIPGTGDLRHLEENVAAGALRLSEEELAFLGGQSGDAQGR